MKLWPIFGLFFSCRRLRLKKIEFLSEPFGKLNLLERAVRISALNYPNPVSNMSSECFSIFKTETCYLSKTVVTEMLIFTIFTSTVLLH